MSAECFTRVKASVALQISFFALLTSGCTSTDPRPVDGVCGLENGATLASAPVMDLCATGGASLVDGTGPWTWTCSGIHGGVTTTCSATLQEPSQPSSFTLTSPHDYQVVQRDTDDRADVMVAGAVITDVGAIRVRVRRGGADIIDATYVSSLITEGSSFAVPISLPAGGWFDVFVQQLDLATPSHVLAEATVAHVGVGEVFVTAGQSNSVRSGETYQAGSALTAGAAVVDAALVWTSDIDSLSVGATGNGSPWPVFASLLSQQLGLPVAIIEVGCGGTSLTQWLPAALGGTTSWCIDAPGGLYEQLLQAVTQLGSLRAILWHQGENETVSATSQADYETRLTAIMDQLNVDTSHVAAPWRWFVANASYFPLSEVDTSTCALTYAPVTLYPYMAPVRRAQQHLWATGEALPGPDTDGLIGSSYRYPGEAGACVHFSDAGLKAHGTMWYDKVVESGLVPGAALGDTYTTQPIYRYVSTFDHRLTLENADLSSAGYSAEGAKFALLADPPAGGLSLYPCLFNRDHFVTTSSDCDTFTHDGASMGYIFDSPQVWSTPLYSFNSGFASADTDFLTTTDLDEGMAAAYVLQWIHGYVPR